MLSYKITVPLEKQKQKQRVCVCVCMRVLCGCHAHLHVHTYSYMCKHGRGKMFVLISHVIPLSVHTHTWNMRKTQSTLRCRNHPDVQLSKNRSGVLRPSSWVCTGRLRGASCSRQVEGLGPSRLHPEPSSRVSYPTPQYFKTDSRETCDKRRK